MLIILGVASACSSTPANPSFGVGYRAAIGHYRSEFQGLQSQARSVIGGSVESQLAVFDRMRDVTASTVVALRQLTPPVGFRPTFTRLVDVLSRQETDLRKIHQYARTGDQAGLDAALSSYATTLQTGASLQRQLQDAVARPTAHS